MSSLLPGKMWILLHALFALFGYLEGENDQLSSFEGQFSQQNDVCISKECVLSAATLIKNMDETANPCDDFYQYSCGGFMTRNAIPEDKTSLNSFNLLQEDLNQRIKVIVEAPKDETEPKCFWKIKDIYSACMNMAPIESVGAKPLEDLLESVGGWPVVSGDQWKAEDFDWVETIFKFHTAGISVDYLFDLSISKDFKNTTYMLIKLDQPSFGMDDRAYLLKGFNDSLVNAYYQLMVNVALRLGASKHDAEKQLKKSLEFEMTLANFSLPREERRNFTKLYNKMTVGDLNEISSKIDWLKYFNKLLLAEIKSDEPIVVSVPKYLKDALDFISSAPKRTIANYLMWRVAFDNILHLDKEFRTMGMKYTTEMTGQMQESPRWLICMDEITSAMPVSLGSMYVRRYFNNDAKKEALEMVKNIRKEFEEILNDITWMDAKTKKLARAKLSAIGDLIAYPEELLNDKLLDALYSNISVNPDDHFANLMSVRKYATNFSYSLLGTPVNRTDWRFYGDAADVNAYYDPMDNNIYFPAGILQGNFFDSKRPHYLNYGAIGFIIGHEITHGFDDLGKQFDKDGNLENWWDEDTDDMFDQKVRCIIEKYSNYTVPENGMKINGFNTQAENIADNGGYKEAYTAYQKWANRNGVEPVLPGMNLTQNQLFWLSFANVWCSTERPEQLAFKIMTGAHSPNRFRVNGPASNSVKFSEDFNCPKGSPMNPLRKCAVW